MALFVLEVKRRCKVIQMWELNSAPTFLTMMMKMQNECDTLGEERKMKIHIKNHC